MKLLAFLLFLTAFLTANFWHAVIEVVLGLVAYLFGAIFGSND